MDCIACFDKYLDKAKPKNPADGQFVGIQQIREAEKADKWASCSKELYSTTANIFQSFLINFPSLPKFSLFWGHGLDAP